MISQMQQGKYLSILEIHSEKEIKCLKKFSY
jgi:hypothetical protein